MVTEVGREEIDQRYVELDADARQSGYFLNPEQEFTRGLVEGLLINQKRYGYESCPCRLSMGVAEEDRDIICPCDYRDSDIAMYGACYCGLYISQELYLAKKPAPAIPESRPPRSERVQKTSGVISSKLPYPVWRCKVCGYLAARNSPPEICPICKAKKERFEKFVE
jgi:ferredoxin-thioredoxin reductase catalytic chain